MRITRNVLEAKVDTVNGMLGNDPGAPYPTVGNIILSGAYGGHAVHRVMNDGGGREKLSGGHGPAREAAAFLDGMMTALRIAKEN